MTKEEILDYVMNSPENTNRVVLSDMLNELVNSSTGGGGLVVNLSEDGVFDKTWKEIYDVISAGASVFLKYPDDTDPQFGIEKKMEPVASIFHDTGTETSKQYVVQNLTGAAYVTNEETGYPTDSIEA